MSPLRQQMQADMVLRGFAKTTQAAYLSVVIAIAKHFSPLARSTLTGRNTAIFAALDCR